MENLKQNQQEPKTKAPEALKTSPETLERTEPKTTKTLGKLTVEHLMTPEDFFLTDDQRQEIAEKYRKEERERAVDDMKDHALEIRSIEQAFAKQLHRKHGKIDRTEFEKWEDAFTDEWREIEKIVNRENLDIRTQAEGKEPIRTYFVDKELDQTIEAFAGNFYDERARALNIAIENSNDPEKDQDALRASSFFASVGRHLDFKYPKEEIFLRMGPDRFEHARTKAHNDAIEHLNDLNDLAKKYHTRPFTVRNFWTSNVAHQTPAMSSLMRYDHDIVEEYYYQAFTDEEDKRRSAAQHLRTYGIY